MKTTDRWLGGVATVALVGNTVTLYAVTGEPATVTGSCQVTVICEVPVSWALTLTTTPGATGAAVVGGATVVLLVDVVVDVLVDVEVVDVLVELLLGGTWALACPMGKAAEATKAADTVASTVRIMRVRGNARPELSMSPPCAATVAWMWAACDGVVTA